MAKIFISYRRSDSRQITSRIHDRMIQAFSKTDVFKDIDNIPPGRDFPGVLHKATANCEVMLVIIGPNWLDASDDAGNRRLDDLDDFVRLEVETGLQHKDTLVIPILVEKATMPSASALPESLRKLARRHAFDIDDDRNFHHDVDKLIDYLHQHIASNTDSRHFSFDSRWIISAVLGLLITVVTVIMLSIIEDDSTLSDTETIAVVNVPDDTLTPTLTEIPSLIPTLVLSQTEVEGTIQAEINALVLANAQTADANETATAEQERNHERGTAAALTLTATQWTSTPTINTRATAEARLTETIVAIGATATMNAQATNESADTATAEAQQTVQAQLNTTANVIAHKLSRCPK